MECPSSSVGDGLFMAERVGDGLPVDERADGAISMESIVKLWTTYMIGICRGSDCRWYRDDDPTAYTTAPMLETAPRRCCYSFVFSRHVAVLINISARILTISWMLMDS